MFKLFSIQTIFSVLLFTSLSYSQYNALPHNFSLYEQKCDSPRKELSKRVLDIGLHYCTEDQNSYLKGCQLVKPPVYEELSFDECPITDNKRSSDTLYLGTNPYIYESCFFASTLLGAHLWDEEEDKINGKKNKKKCEKKEEGRKKDEDDNEDKSEEKDEKKKPPAYYLCESSSSSNPQKVGKEARSCIDRNYITGITKAFNEMAECFDFNNDKDRKRLFAKFHVESRLLLRKVEDRPDAGTMKSTNRCFGQLKNTLISDLNKYIHFGDEEKEKNYEEKGEAYVSLFFKYGDIYKKALDKCPFLSNLLVPRPSDLQGKFIEDPNKKNTFLQVHIDKEGAIICKTSQDPYSCLFYSMYNARRNLLDITEQLEKLKKSKNYEESFYIDGVPLFKNEDDLKWSFVFWAHNGGNGIIKNTFPKFISTLKEKIIAPVNMCKRTCGCQSPKNKNDKCTQRCLNKCKFKSLTTSDLHRKFSAFIKDSEDIINPEEVSDFMNKIKNQIPALSRQGKVGSALNYFHKKKECDDEKPCDDECDKKFYDEEKLQELIKSTQQNCPMNINQIFDYS